MYNVYIEQCDDIGMWQSYFDDIKDEFVAIGNKDYNTHKTEWWEKAEEKFNDYIYEQLEDKEMKQIEKIQESSKNDIETTYRIAKEILGYDVKYVQIKGYCQSEWQNVFYEKEYESDLGLYEALYFGMYKELTLKDVKDEDNIYSDIITDDELWELKRGNLREELEKRQGEKINKVYEFDGYIKTPKYKEVA